MSAIWNRLVRSSVPSKFDEDFKDAVSSDKVASTIDKYNNFYDYDKDEKKTVERKADAQDMTNAYYDVVTDFYEYGWGQSFHFAPRFAGETFDESIARHEYYLAHKMGIEEKRRILDVGCGVGGPLRNMARFTNCHITGLNNNAYQVKRAKRLNKKAGLADQTDVVKGDFMKMKPFKDNTFDYVYSIEATCHASDRTGCFSQIARVLKPGGVYGCYEWAMTDKYDPKNETHRRIKHGIEEGNSLPELTHISEVVSHIEAAGLEVISVSDPAEDFPKRGFGIGWYSTFKPSWTCANIKHTSIGRLFTQTMVNVLEFLRVAPKGTSETHTMLTKTADALYEGGRTGIFTPMVMIICRKPDGKKKKKAKTTTASA